MKKIFALLLVVATLVTSMAVPSFAADEIEQIAGGFDFYSITIHYSQPIVVDYVHDAKKAALADDDVWTFGEPKTSYTISAAEFSTNSSKTTNQSISYGETTLANNAWVSPLYAVSSSELGIDSSELAFNKNYGVTNITNDSVVALEESVSLYGVQQFYDDAGTRNPNFKFENEYFKDATTGARIDDNGFVLDDNNIWHNFEGKRVEPFVEKEDGTLVWVSLELRKDANGRAIDYNKITNEMLQNAGLITMPDDVSAGSSKAQKDWLADSAAIALYLIKFDGESAPTGKALEKYNAKDRVITQDDIETKQIGKNIVEVRGTPVVGQPEMNDGFAITKITIEIDAMGESMPVDIASDPQQANEIYITTNDVYKNVKTALDFVAENPDKEYTDGIIIGSAKSVTTKTALDAETKGLPTTIKSVDVTLTEGVTIPANAKLYFNFKVAQNQPDAAKEYKLMNTPPVGSTMSDAPGCFRPLAISASALDTSTLPDAPKASSNGCKSVIAGSVAVLGAMAIAVVVLKKKED